jgi:hypothetical protein
MPHLTGKKKTQVAEFYEASCTTNVKKKKAGIKKAG